MIPSRVVVIGPADVRSLMTAHAPEAGDRLSDVEPLASPPVEHLVAGLLATDTEVDLVTCSPTVPAPVVVRSGRLSAFVAPYRSRGRGRDGFRVERRALAALLHQTTGTLVHAHWTYEFALATLSDRRPRVVTIHDAPLTILRHLPDPYRVVRAGMAARLRMATFTGIAVSPYLADRWRVQLRDRRRLHVIPDAVVVSSAAAAVRRCPGRVVTVADSSSRKNVRRLLEAMAVVRRDAPHARLVLAGGGLGPADPLADWARRSGLARGVEWRGRIPHAEVLTLVGSGEVLAHPSREESFGMSVAEAMNLGVPVVAGSRSGAIPWLLDDGSAGILVDVESVTSLAAGITQVLQQPALADRLRRRAADRAADFSRTVVVRRHRELYEMVAERAALTPVDRTRAGQGAATAMKEDT